ncbi:AraC family ligand binding domain-containing protein [Vibrio sp. PP-XX7]
MRDLHHEKTTQTDWHHHEQGQVFWVRRGFLSVETQEEHWTVTTGCIGWIPSGCEHKTNVMANIQGHLLYLPETWCTALPTRPKLVTADPFLSALVERIVAFDKSSSLLTTLSLSPHNGV